MILQASIAHYIIMSLLDYHYPTLDDDSDLLRMSTLIEREFINALSLGSGAARSFADRFAHFEQVAQTKLRSDSIEPDSSVAVAHTVALNISTVAGSLIEAEEKADQLSTELFRDIVDVFSTLSLQTNDQPLFMNTAPTPQSKLLHSSSRCSLSKIASSSSIARESTPDYRPSRQWLLQHLHSPYPNLSTRKKLAQQSGVSLKAINEWFTHMRRRVGWTSISRNFFGGNKQLAIDGARCILTEGTGPCYYSEDVIKAFEDMKIKAERLLDGEPNESNLAKRLGNMLGGESSPEDMLQSRSRNSGLRKKRGYIQLEIDECANDHIDGTLPAMDMQPSKRAKFVIHITFLIVLTNHIIGALGRKGKVSRHEQLLSPHLSRRVLQQPSLRHQLLSLCRCLLWIRKSQSIDGFPVFRMNQPHFVRLFNLWPNPQRESGAFRSLIPLLQSSALV